MRSLTSFVTVLATASLTHAHVEFVRLAHNGVWKAPLEYIRNRTAEYPEAPSDKNDGYRTWSYPVQPGDRPESFRCGRDNLAWAKQTKVLKVKGGDTIEFVAYWWPPQYWNDTELVQWDSCPGGRGICDPKNLEYGFGYHEGPSMMYLSPVPTGQSITTYDGSGEWVKIYTAGFEIRKELDFAYWLPSHGHRLIATLPKQTPAGQYLLRVDNIYPGSGGAYPQVYPGCAQIEVESSFSGELPKGIKIPEAFSVNSTGMMYNDDNWPMGPKGYTYPGGPQWDGEKMVEVKAPRVTQG